MKKSAKEMNDFVCRPLDWPLGPVVLSLVRRPVTQEKNEAVILWPFSEVTPGEEFAPDRPIKIFFVNMFQLQGKKPTDLEFKTYRDLWALWDDGWEID